MVFHKMFHSMWISTQSIEKQMFCLVHSKATYERHTNEIRVHTSDVQITSEYIRVTQE